MTAVLARRPAILDAIPRDRAVLIEASAGTGKTFTLEHLVVDLLLASDLRVDQLLVVTFTKKATSELRARLRDAIARLAGLRASEPAGSSSWSIDDAARAKLARALAAFDTATISTIHGFCQRVLAENAFLGGRLLDEEPGDGVPVLRGAFRERVREELRRGSPAAELVEACVGRRGLALEKLEDRVVEAAKKRAPLVPVLDEAELRASLVATGLHDGAFAALLAALRAEKLHGSTRSAIERRLASVAAGVAAALSAPGTVDLVCALGDVAAPMREARDKLFEIGGAGTRMAERLARVVAAHVPLESLAVTTWVPLAGERAAARKREAGVFDFDDMLTLVRDLLDGPAGAAVAARLRRRYRVALVDEFQDTDDVQWDVFRRVFFEGGGGSTLVAIGDPKQAIYAFRGADVHTYLRAKDAIARAGGPASTVALRENFRSTSALIEACDALFAPGTRAFFDGAVGYAQGVVCGRPALGLTDARGAPVSPVHLFRVGADGAKALAGEVRERHAAAIARAVAALSTDRGALFLGEGAERRRLGPGDVFVLVPSRTDAAPVADALRAARVPHAFFRQAGLFQTDAAAALLAVLRALEAPDDRGRRLAAWLSPFFGVPLDALDRATELPASHPLVARLAAWRALADARDFSSLVRALTEGSGVVRRELLAAPDPRFLTDVTHVLDVLSEEAGRGAPSLGDLVAKLAAWVDERETPPENADVRRIESTEGAVQIMTMHVCKGLEAPLVFLFGGLSRTPERSTVVEHHDAGGRRVARLAPFDDARAEIEREAAEENQRLLYVALTRARGRLYLPTYGPPPGAPPSRTAYTPSGRGALLERRLRALLADPTSTFARACTEEDVAALAPGASPPLAPAPPLARVPDAPDAATVAATFRARADHGVTSYTRLARLASAGHAALERSAAAAPVEVSEPRTLPATELPGGAASGVFLHEILERLPLDEVARAETLAAFRASPAVRRVLAAASSRHGIDPRHVPHVEAMVHRALTTPIATGSRAPLPGVARADRVLREVEFVYPIPAPADPPGLARGASRADRGFVRGFLDALVSHGDRLHVGDWKSDALASFAPAAVEAHVADHYADQIALYGLAVAKLLGAGDARDFEARMGSIFYVFLRGDDAGRAVVWALTPTWDDVLGWDAGLRGRRDLGFGGGHRG